jgi:dolichol-phosphate mannosyltransferase
MVVPTKDEAGNVAELVRRVSTALPDYATELLFVDDSKDDTPDVVRAVSQDACIEVLLVHRADRWGGLGGAVVDGMRVARGPWICVMDGDLQHPPEVVPKLVDQAIQGLDLVVAGRRHIGTAGQPVRRALSLTSSGMAKVLFPLRLRGIRDPLSGFFLVRRASIDLDALRPRGFKVLLDVLVRSGDLRVGEVTFDFGTRFAGDSKVSVREVFRYIMLLASLRLSSLAPRITRRDPQRQIADETAVTTSNS